MIRAVFLDRDGVLNLPEMHDGVPYPPQDPADFRLYPEAKAGCELLRQAGFRLVVVTNQPDVGRGMQTIEAVERMHAMLAEALAPDRIEVCTAADASAPDAFRRKPAPGMLLDAARALEIDLAASYMIGDRWRDIDCGHAAGCRTIFIERGYAEKLRQSPHHYAANMLEAARLILRLEKPPQTAAINGTPLADLPVKIFADGANEREMFELYRSDLIRGLTTNPTLMRKAGIRDYETFARGVLAVVRDKPVSFEVLSDDFDEMHRQARRIGGWQENVFVKIPITNTRGESALPLVQRLAGKGVRLNLTAILTLAQVEGAAAALAPEVPAVVSVLAGRIADTGIDPIPLMRRSREILQPLPRAELLWGSVREVLNLYQAAQSGAHIVTVSREILAKAAQFAGRDLAALSVETVQMFYDDAVAAGYQL
jgi:transaldolase